MIAVRLAWCVALVAACDAGERKPTAKPTKEVPAGPYVVHYDCFHSDQPFGPGSDWRNLTYDLGARTITLVVGQNDGEDARLPPPPGSNAKPEPTPEPPQVSKLDDAHAAKIEAAVLKVLRGGPYQPEYAVPEGIPCELRIEAAGREVFKLEKAFTKNKDAATELIQAFPR